MTAVPADRSRDSLGRPLPDDADPALAVPGVPVRSQLTDAEAWDEGLSYLADGMPFHAHEVFEMRWRLAPAASRTAWRALAQCQPATRWASSSAGPWPAVRRSP